MKRYVAILMVLCCLVGLPACGAGNRTGGGNGLGNSGADAVSHAISVDDLMQAMRSAGYSVEVDENVSVQDLGVAGASAVTMLGYHKIEGVVEKGGFAYFFEFDNSEDAISAYNELVSLAARDGIYLHDANGANGEKSVFTDDEDPKFGTTHIFTQVENTLIVSLEEWDIDGSGTYDYELNDVLESLGY